jgi:hypothetical protein
MEAGSALGLHCQAASQAGCVGVGKANGESETRRLCVGKGRHAQGARWRRACACVGATAVMVVTSDTSGHGWAAVQGVFRRTARQVDGAFLQRGGRDRGDQVGGWCLRQLSSRVVVGRGGMVWHR